MEIEKMCIINGFLKLGHKCSTARSDKYKCVMDISNHSNLTKLLAVVAYIFSIYS